MYRKLILLTLILFLNTSFIYFAQDLQELTKQQEELKAKVDKVNEKIMSYEKRINTISDEIDANNKKIEEIEKKKKKKQVQIDESRENLTATMQLLQRMNNTNTLSTYFYSDATENNNYFLKLDNINTVFDTISQDLGIYIEEIKDLDKEQQEIKKIKKDNRNKKKRLNEAIEKQRTIEDNLKQELNDVEGDIASSLVSSGGSSSSNKTAIMSQAGISSSDYQYVDYIVNRESGWNSTAANPTSSAYGLCQSLPGSKMASAGSDWQSNPVTQMKWCNDYAVGRYGSWGAAYNFWISNHWW